MPSHFHYLTAAVYHSFFAYDLNACRASNGPVQKAVPEEKRRGAENGGEEGSEEAGEKCGILASDKWCIAIVYELPEVDMMRSRGIVERALMLVDIVLPSFAVLSMMISAVPSTTFSTVA